MTLARRILRNLYRLIPSEPLRRAEPTPAPPPPEAMLRLYLFSADFPDPVAAHDFCFATPGPDLPTQLTRELEGAYVDTAEVEVIHGDILTRLAEFLPEAQVRDLDLRMAGDSTLILLTERAFGGLPFDLDDTDHLTYLGSVTVEE